jgi:hypothetical protein
VLPIRSAYVHLKAGISEKTVRESTVRKPVGKNPTMFFADIDNAPHHNVQLNRAPNSNSRRDVMISWLKYYLPPITFKNADFSSLRNLDLHNMILPLKPKYLSYKIDIIFAEHNHSILRLPPYHPELNRIELIWATVKKWVAQNNTTCKMDEIGRAHV